MKGKLEKIGNEWYVKYVHYDGGGSFRLPLHPDDQGYMNCFLYVDKDTEVDYKEVLVNPMGREVDHTNLGQNHTSCIWYAKLVYDEDGVKDKQKQHLIDIMESDEELGLYDENSPGYNHQAKLVKDLVKEIKIEDVFNDEKREGVKRVIQQHKVLKGLSLVNPVHLQMTSNGHGEFPDGYKLTEKGIQYIIEQLNKE